MTQIVERLPDVTQNQRAQILKSARTTDAHAALIEILPAMTSVEVGGTGSAEALAEEFVVAAWNVERCLFPEASAEMLAAHGVDVVLLSEVDSGMARTGQRNTTADMASVLSMQYAFGVEFYEMDLGGATERHFCKDDFNTSGWHGNGILSSVPFERVGLIRLDEKGHWFVTDGGAGNPEQPRVGGRMAIAAIIPAEFGPVCVVTTHLESNAQSQHRHKEFERLLAAIDAFAPDMPVIIGGDLNTGNHMPPDFDWRDESLFELAEAQGYSWSLSPDGTTTRPSLITPHPDRVMKLDWFCHRRLTGEKGKVVPALDRAGQPLSDHECILARVSVAQ